MINFFSTDKFSSRSSNFLDHYSNVTDVTIGHEETTSYDDTAYEEPTEEYQEGEWVWIPKGYNPPGYYQPASYDAAESRQGILSLVNAQQLVSTQVHQMSI